MSLPFLLEIGTEEIPDWMIPDALENLHTLIANFMAEANFPLIGQVIKHATPRRLFLRVEDLEERQADDVQQVQGPAKSAPKTAVEGFAKKLGVRPEDLETRATPKGEYYCFLKKIEGRQTKDILAKALPDLIPKISFPKTMYWTAKNGPRFIRPIRWIVALLGDEVIPFEIAGVKAGDVTRGHRKLGSPSIPVKYANYEAELRKNF